MGFSPSPLPSTELETKTFSVAKLLEALRRGQVRIPRFQRGFRWQDEDRRLLFDSIQAGYPLGTLLLAKGDAPADRVMLGGYIADVGSEKEALWVVDGQQRLATLAMALIEDHSGTYRPIFFDLLENKFVLGKRRRTAPAHWIPSHVLASSSTLIKWLREAGLKEDLSDQADEIARRVREYTLPAYLVPYDGSDDHLLREIFARTNQRGRLLRSHEVFEALHATLRGDRGPISRVQDDLAELGFGSLEPQDIERAAIAISGAHPHGGGKQLQEIMQDKDLSPLLDRVAVGLSRAIEFLSQEVGVPNIELLPYRGVLATLARFFALHPRPHDRSLELLNRWFWRGTLTGDHKTDNAVDARKWKVINVDEHSSIKQLLTILPTVNADLLTGSLQSYRVITARSKIELLSMVALSPRMLFEEDKGLEVAISALLNEEEPFPFTIVESTPAEKTIAHLLLHPKFRRDQLCNQLVDQDLLESHAIDAPAYSALCAGDESQFITIRSRRLEKHLVEFLSERLALNPPDHDRAPLEAYFVDEDG
jgi:hypothetical protein